MNPTFSRVAKPGALNELLKTLEEGERVSSVSAMYGELESPSDVYRNRGDRPRRIGPCVDPPGDAGERPRTSRVVHL